MMGLWQHYNDLSEAIDRLKCERCKIKQEMEKQVKAHIMDARSIPGIVMDDFWVYTENKITIALDGVRVTCYHHTDRGDKMWFVTNEWRVCIHQGTLVGDIIWNQEVPKEQRDWIMQYKEGLWKAACAIANDWYRYKNYPTEYVYDNF